MKINLGGGKEAEKGFINVDLLPDADVKHDLNKLPYPFKDNSVDFIECRMVFDHLDLPLIDFIKEVRRILKPNGGIHFVVGNYFHWIKRLQFLFGSFELNSDFCVAHKRLLNYLYVVRLFKDHGFQVKSKESLLKQIVPSLLCQQINIYCKKFYWFK